MLEKSILSPAKINLFLHILGKISDHTNRYYGYHRLLSLVTKINLCDKLIFRYENLASRKNDQQNEITIDLTVTGDFAEQCGKAETNLVYLAAQQLLKHANRPIATSIELYKNIPVGSGLGGGSSNAAYCLKFLADLWQVPNAEHVITQIASDLGSDIMLFLADMPNYSFMEETGNIVSNSGLNLPQNLPILLIIPDFAISSSNIYRNIKKSDYSYPKLCITNAAEINAELGKNDYCDIVKFAGLINKYTANHLENTAVRVYPELQYILNWLDKQDEVVISRMTGSGSVSFAIANNDEQLEYLYEKAVKYFPDSYLAIKTDRYI